MNIKEQILKARLKKEWGMTEAQYEALKHHIRREKKDE